MKVLVSAYACEPLRGSEPEIGWRVMLAAAREHDVWVITRSNNIAAIERHLADLPERPRIHLHGLDLGRPALTMKRLGGQPGLFAYYAMWQRAAGALARRLHEQVGFDVAHHATFAVDWTPVGIEGIDVPLVIGPVGGGLLVPPRRWASLGAKGALMEIPRTALLLAGGVLARRRRRRAALVLLQNDAGVASNHGGGDSVVMPNASAIGPFEFHDRVDRDLGVAVVSRLVPHKGIDLALSVIAELPDTDLTIYGEGDDRARLEGLASDLGVEGRVRFAGSVAREELISMVRRHRVLLHPALREEAGLAVSEALALGTPVVAFDRAGPKVLASLWPDQPSTLVAIDGPRSAVVRRLADAVAEHLGQDPAGSDGWSDPVVSFDDVLLDGYRRVAEPS